MPRKTSLVDMLNHIKEEENIHNQLSIEENTIQTAHFLATHPDIRRKWREDLIDLRRKENYVY